MNEAEAQSLNALVAEAEIGDEAKRFLETDLGRCIVAMADQDTESARLALETVDASDPKAIQRLQNKAAMARMFKDYVAELFNRGENALATWRQQTNDPQNQ